MSILVLVAVGMAGCAGPAAAPGDPPTIVRPADRTVVRNTVSPNAVDVTFMVDDTDTQGADLTVRAFSDMQDVVTDSSLVPSCTNGVCTLAFVPVPSRTASVQITIRVSDGGNVVEDAFFVHLIPRWVTNASDVGPGSLRTTIAAAEDGDVIGFDPDAFPSSSESPTEIPLASGQLVLERDVTIEGVGPQALVLRGGSSGRLLGVGNGVSASLSGMTLTGGVGEDCSAILGTAAACGGAILANGAAHLALSDVVITDNSALYGAGIFAHQSNVSIENGRLDLHTANTGGAIYLRGGSARIVGTTVADNGAGVRGGGIYSLGAELTLEASVVMRNRSRSGAGIASVGFSTLHVAMGTSVAQNDARDYGAGILHQGGTATIDASTVSDNTAQRGAGLFNGRSGTMTIQNGSLLRGNVVSGISDLGAGAFNEGGGTLVFTESTASHNHAGFAGGAIASDGVLTIADAVFEDNLADSYGAAVYVTGPATITASVLRNNDVGNHGAAIYNNDTTLVVERSTLENNYAQIDGGGIYSHFGTTEIRDASIVRANRAGHHGGGVYVSNGSLGLLSSTLSGNTSGATPPIAGNGGGIHAFASSVLVDASDIEDNVATDGAGGGVFASISNVQVRAASSLDGNVAVDGAGLSVLGGSLSILGGSSVANNTASGNGGGIATRDGASVVIEGSSVRQNESAGRGGGIVHDAEAQLSVRSSRLANNRAEWGGGIFATSSGVTLDDTTVEENAATNGNGGGVVVINAILDIVRGTIVRANTASERGGGVFVDNASLRLRESTIGGTSVTDGNFATDGGGVGSRVSGVFVESNGTIAFNGAARDGGGLWLHDIATISMNGATVSDNAAQGLGGGVYYDVLSGSTDALTSVDVADNTASDGGGIYRAGDHAFNLDGVTFSGNSPNDAAP